MNDINTNPDTEEASIATSSDIITEMITGIPDPIKKNAIKAFGQLCTAAVDIPVAYLEGKSKEMRAGTDARVNLIKIGTEKISEQMSIPKEYADAAVHKFGQKIIQERINIDAIANNAQHELASYSSEDTNTENNKEEISSDWLNSFEQEVSTKSSKEMQLLFGKILAGEIKRPSSYSIKTIKILSQLDSNTAKLFQNFCSLCISFQDYVSNTTQYGVIFTTGKSAGLNSLIEYRLSFTDLNLLHEYGLIQSTLDSGIPTNTYLGEDEEGAKPIQIDYNGKVFSLFKVDSTISHVNTLSGPTLTASGKELFNIIDKTPNNKYTSALHDFLKKQGIEMTLIEREK